MKKISISLLVSLLSLSSTAQNKYVDSLKKLLAGTSKPIEQFTLVNKIQEANNGITGSYQDTSSGAQLYRIAQQLKNDSLLAISFNVIGNYFRVKGENPIALEYFFKAIPLAEKAKDKRRLSSLYFDIAGSYSSLQNLKESFKYAKIGEANLPDKSSLMYDYMAGQFYYYMAENYLGKNQPDSALRYIHQMEQVNSKLKEPNSILLAFLLSGRAYAQLKDNEMAELYFKKANMLTDSIGSAFMRLNFLGPYTGYLLGINQYAKAKPFALAGLKIGNELNNNIVRFGFASSLNTVYSNLHKTDSAYGYLAIQSALKDSVFSQSNLNKMQALAFNEQIRKIDEEEALAVAKEEHKQNIQFALIAFGIISFIIIFLLLSHSIIINTKMIEFLGVVALLIVFEFLNLLLHPFLERVTHHSPVFMLMALVCIAALLAPLHHKTERWATHKLVEKNKLMRLVAAKKTIEQLESNS